MCLTNLQWFQCVTDMLVRVCAFMMHSRCVRDVLMAHSWCISGAILFITFHYFAAVAAFTAALVLVRCCCCCSCCWYAAAIAVAALVLLLRCCSVHSVRILCGFRGFQWSVKLCTCLAFIHLLTSLYVLSVSLFVFTCLFVSHAFECQ